MSPSQVSLPSVGTMRREGLKCQNLKNGTVGKFALEQAEKDRGDRPLPAHDNNRSVGVRRIRTRDVLMRTFSTFVNSIDSDVNNSLVRMLKPRH